MIRAFYRRVRQALCAHPHRVRERRDTEVAPKVLHFVCASCGQAVPAITRETVEQLQALRTGRVRKPRVHRTSRVLTFTRRQG
jgi:hypothetical protein